MKKRLINMGERKKKHSNLEAVLVCVWLELSSSANVHREESRVQRPYLPARGTSLLEPVCTWHPSPATAWEAAGLGQGRRVRGRGGREIKSNLRPHLDMHRRGISDS